MLTAVAHPSEMALTAEQHAQLAKTYEKAAADCHTAPEQHAVFLRKANCSRILARLAEMNEQRESLLDRIVSSAKDQEVLGLRVALPTVPSEIKSR